MSQQTQYPQSEQGSSFNMTAPEPADSFNMDVISRSPDLDTAFAQYSLALGQLSHGSFPDYRTLPGNGHGHPVLPQDPGRTAALPMVQFMRGDAPWTPLRADATSRTTGSKPRQPNGFYEYSCFTNFRNTAAPSDADDSGYYGSNLGSIRPSVVGASVCGETDGGTETQSFIQPFSDLQLHQSRSPEIPPAGGKHRQKEPWNRPAGSEATLVCPTCSSPVKTKAELNKHKMRHDKPFRCDIPGCSRKQGFGTTNDLDRHKKSVHGAMGLKFRCDQGLCKNKLKDWPRADNFKQHLKRIHNIDLGPDADLSRYEYNPSMPEDLACLGSSEAQMAAQADLSPPPWIGPVDSNQETHGLPSGEIALDQPDHVMELAPRGLVGEDMSAMSQTQNHWESNRMQIDMDPLLSGLETHQPQSAAPSDLYTGSAYKPDVVSPADLSSPGTQSRGSSGPSEAQIGTHRIHRDSRLEARPNDRRPGTASEETAEVAAEEHSTRPASEASAAEEAEGDTADGLHDIQVLCPTVKPSHIILKTSASQEDKPIAPEPQTSRDLLEAAKMDESEASALVESLIEKGMFDKIVGRFGYQKAKEEDEKADEAKSDESSASSAAPAGKEEKGVMCSESGCGKVFKRHCELKKHIKRHMKPYACTHAECTKRFGSKNDWKRHENSQHIQLEFWRCAERMKDSTERTITCGKICHRRETFKHHLEKDHGISDQKASEKRCTDCRNGRNFESRYWCGFCKCTIEFEKSGGLAGSERFDHIDAHFTGKSGAKMDISEWKSIESEPLETFQTILTRSIKTTPPVSSSPDGTSDQSDPDSARKRRGDNDDEASAKRQKRGNYKSIGESILWVCCSCDNMYVRAMTTRCMESGCSHTCCGNCNLMLQEE